MKKFLAILIMIFFLCSCNPVNTEKHNYKPTASSGVWITYNEINEMLLSANGFENEVNLAVENCKKTGTENVYIHVRSHCDSLFDSDYFPLKSSVKEKGFDAFKVLLDAFHKEGIAVHAWVNPYRVITSSNDIEQLDHNSPAYKWLKDDNKENDRNICFYNGIYLNPAEPQVQGLILNGIKEIIEKYDVDGIHFDDYFYPTTDAAFDEISYTTYCNATEKPLSLEDWRRTNVNALISSCYNVIKHKDETVLFTVSPAASVEKNYNEAFADVKEWVKSGYVDCIIPQLYFGFEYPQNDFKFNKLLDDWKKIAEQNDKVSLFIGLASYKIGTDSVPDSAEWKNNDDIIAKQAEICYKDSSVHGYVLFSYSSLFSNNELNIRQRENLLQIAQQYSLSKGEAL